MAITEELTYESLVSCKVNDLIPVTKYRSKRTGLTLILAEVEGPVINGYFCLATEAFDDDGLPHTLEHLIFLGSDDYPYKGMLDRLANRCLASGTNAWTDTDHTCYTMTTAGAEGFLALLPIYLDHILHPTLTDCGFTTEVHHINGDGEDAGVVYCEMQGRENSGESRVHRTMLQALYPGHCGYKSETGGILSNLRESTTNEKVRKYHQEFYRVENLTLIVTGQIAAHEIFKVIESLEDKIVSRRSVEKWVRPWQNPVPQLEAAVDQLVPYPCEDEENGMVWVAWRGPLAVQEHYQICGLMMLMEYLTDTSVSPLQKAFVEDEAYASRVGYSFLENASTAVYLIFENVPVSKLAEVELKLFELLRKLEFDMKRINTVIHRRILEQLSALENNPHDSVAFMAIGDVLFGHTEDDFRKRFNQVEEFRRLKSEPEAFWRNLLTTYLLNAPAVITRGLPSPAEMEALAAEEKKRIEEQRSLLGPDGLKKKATELETAMEANEVPPPAEVISRVPVPSIDSIQFHHMDRYSNAKNGKVDDGIHEQRDHPKFPISNLPMKFQLDSVQTSFVYLLAMMDSSDVPNELRLYFPLLMELLVESPIQRGADLIPYEQVVAQLSEDTVKAAAFVGVEARRFHCGAFCQLAVLFLQLEEDKYEKGVQWLHELLYDTKITAERVKVVATKMINDVAQFKRKGPKMISSIMRELLFNKESNHKSASVLRQQAFLNQMLKQLETEEAAKVIESMELLRSLIIKNDVLTIHMAAHVERLSDPYAPWVSVFGSQA